MKKTLLIILGTFVAVLLLVVIAGMFKFNYLASQTGYDVDGNKINTSEKTPGPKNSTYRIDGEPVTFIDGISEKEAAPGSATIVETRYFGNEVHADLNDDGREDTIFLLSQNTGGSGTFFYAVAALNTEAGWVGSQGFSLGDRIAPQTTELSRNPSHKDVIVVNYFDHGIDQSMSETPSVSKSVWLKLDIDSMTFGEVEQKFAGEANPDSMTLDMQSWTWIKTTYNNDTELVPKQTDAFTLTFNNDESVSVATDCNSMSSTYEIDNNKIKFGAMASTMMFCQDSQEQDFAKVLSETQSFFFTSKGELILELKFNSGSATFR